MSEAPDGVPLTAHELARRLLALPDLPVIAENDGSRFRLVRAYLVKDADWAEPDQVWIEEQPAIVVADFTDINWLE